MFLPYQEVIRRTSQREDGSTGQWVPHWGSGSRIWQRTEGTGNPQVLPEIRRLFTPNG